MGLFHEEMLYRSVDLIKIYMRYIFSELVDVRLGTENS